MEVDGTDWKEPVLLWLSIVMPTGMGKSPLCTFLRNLVRDAHNLTQHGYLMIRVLKRWEILCALTTLSSLASMMSS